MTDALQLFEEMGGRGVGGVLPQITSPVFHTEKGAPYLKGPGVVMLSKPDFSYTAMREFLEDFEEDLGFSEYVNDSTLPHSGAALCKTAGQLCYMSFGPGRTKNVAADKYFENIIKSGHGSVLEHAHYSFLFYGVSRSLTHELVRHRPFNISQVSQRYVDGSRLRFVERPEFQNNERLHMAFEVQIDMMAGMYEITAKELLSSMEDEIKDLPRTDARKKVNQAARAILPNQAEAPIIVTGNVRIWRHFIEMRASSHAEVEIRNLAFRAFLCLHQIEPILFGDYYVTELPDGTYEVDTPNRKV